MSNVGQKNVWQMDKDHFIHPYTDFSTFGQEGSQVISRASGVHVIDNEGSRYIDAIAGLWCVNVGHGRAEIADAVRQQILDMQFFNPFGHSTNEPAAIFAEKLAQLSPGDLNHVFYSTGGSTANDIAVRFAHYYHAQNGEPLRTKIISRLDGYHGSTYLAASLTGIHATKIGFNRIAEDVISHVSAANLYRRPEGMNESEYCDYLVQEFRARIEQLGPDNVAAFIAEPIMGAGGVLVAHPATTGECGKSARNMEFSTSLMRWSQRLVVWVIGLPQRLSLTMCPTFWSARKELHQATSPWVQHWFLTKFMKP